MSTPCVSTTCSGYLSGSFGNLFASSFQVLYASQCFINDYWPPDASGYYTDLDFDFIVVGGGSAGSVLAARLSEDSCRKVLLVEAGGDPPFESQIPAASGALHKTSVDWQYLTENDKISCQGMVDGKSYWPAGKMLGGDSSINDMKYLRGNRKDYDDFEAAGNPGWNYEEVLKYFKKSENMSDKYIEYNDILTSYHNYNGPIGVTTYTHKNAIEEFILEGYKDLGYMETYDINGPLQYGVFKMQSTINNGRRDSTARAYLVPARNRKNLVIFKNSLVSKILLNNKVATGVAIQLSNGSIVEALARKEVIVSAGAIRTPQILMLSGIGRKELLTKFNISTVVDAAVGENLVDHVFVPLIVTINEDLPLQIEVETILDVVNYITTQTGTYARQSGVGPNICTFLNTNSTTRTTEAPDIQIFHSYQPKNSTNYYNYCKSYIRYKEEICDSILTHNLKSPFLLIYPALLNQDSRGYITLASDDVNDSPKIYANSFDDQKDIKRIIKAINIIKSLIKTPTFRSIGARLEKINIPNCDHLKYPSFSYWTCYIRNIGSAIWHTRGTAKMGPETDPNAVVNPELQVYGIKNLRVVDASVIPGTIRGNTCSPTVMFAERASDIIKSKYNEDC